jgi:ATP phosphoribosyltransferase
MSKLKLAIQKKGRLSEKSLDLLKRCGINISNGVSTLKAEAGNFPLELLFLRDDDIPQYVEQQVADVGILGENEVLEKSKDLITVKKLGFAKCRLSLAIPKNEEYTGLEYFRNKKIATSYPRLLENHFNEAGIEIITEEISGSVEIAPGIGLSDAVCDIVSSGSTLYTNGLKEVETILKSEAVMISSQNLSEEKQQILDELIFRIDAVMNAASNKYILMNTPNDKIEEICKLLPGMKSPTVTPLAEPGWSSLHTVVKEDVFWEVISKLRALGAEGILVVPIEKMIR